MTGETKFYKLSFDLHSHTHNSIKTIKDYAYIIDIFQEKNLYFNLWDNRKYKWLYLLIFKKSILQVSLWK